MTACGCPSCVTPLTVTWRRLSSCTFLGAAFIHDTALEFAFGLSDKRGVPALCRGTKVWEDIFNSARDIGSHAVRRRDW
jgi:hypothetical protein